MEPYRDVRQARLLLAVEALLSAAIVAAGWLPPPAGRQFRPLAAFGAAVAIGLSLVSLAAWVRPRAGASGFALAPPPDRPAFLVPGRLAPRMVPIALLPVMAALTVTAFRGDHVLVPFVAPLLVLQSILALLAVRRFAPLALRPAGLEQATPLGYRLIPWTAFGVDDVAAGRNVVVRIGRRDSVHRTGIGPGRSITLAAAQLAVDPELVAGAVRHYAAHPADRAAIGTPAEHARLLAAARGGPHPAGNGTPAPTTTGE